MSVDGTRMAYRVAGEGAPVVLVHGWPTSSMLWHHQCARLSRHARVYAPDLPGFAASDGFADGRYSWERYANTLRGYLDELGIDKASFVGHDIGAPAVLLLAMRWPERVDRLAILNTTPFPSLPWLVRLLVAACRAPLLGDLVVSRLGFRLLFAIGTSGGDADAAALARRFHEPLAREPQARKRLQTILASLDIDELRRVEAGLSRLEHDTLVLWGARDPIGPEATAYRLDHQLPNSTLRLLKDRGHFLPEDAPEAVTRELAEFLARELPRNASSPVPQARAIR